MSKLLDNTRAQQVLNALVARYIKEGQPVGSKVLVSESGLDVSAATVRNLMAELEHHGYLSSPHTSAGRVPTVKGYRFFVDNLLELNPIPRSDEGSVAEQLSDAVTSKDIVKSASSLLSSLTRLAGIVTVPNREHMILKHVEFLQLSDAKILVVLVFNDRDVQNRIIQTESTYTASQLEEASNYLNAHYAGMELHEIREKILEELDKEHIEIQSAMQNAMKMAKQAFESSTSEDYVVSGEANLLDIAELKGIKHMRSIFDAFAQKHEILKLLDQCLDTNGVQIFIGNESGVDIFDDCSVVTAPYMAEGEVLGVLGVIGPTRMDYKRAISTVEVTAKMLSKLLG